MCVNPALPFELGFGFQLVGVSLCVSLNLRYETGSFFWISRATYCGVSVRVKGVGSSCPVPYRRWRNPLNSPSEPISSNLGSGLTGSTMMPFYIISQVDEAILL